MFYVYPCVLNPEEGGGFYVTFPDVPGALTNGKDRGEALAMAEDALTARFKRDMFKSIGKFQYRVRRWTARSLLPYHQSLLLNWPFYTAMRRQGIKKTALAKRLGLSESGGT